MTLDWHDRFRDQYSNQATRLILRDAHGNILLVAVDLEGVVIISRRGDDDFPGLLRQLGLREPTDTILLQPSDFQTVRV